MLDIRQQQKTLFRQSWVERMTMSMLTKWQDNIPDIRPSNYEQLFKMACYSISLIWAQSTLMFRQNTRHCTIDRAVSLWPHSHFWQKHPRYKTIIVFCTPSVIANYIDSIANIISNTIAIGEAINTANEDVWESEEPEFIFQITFDIC